MCWSFWITATTLRNDWILKIQDVIYGKRLARCLSRGSADDVVVTLSGTLRSGISSPQNTLQVASSDIP